MKKEKIKLNLGCGNSKIESFINVDIREEVNPDIVDDISNLDSFEENSVDLIYACHVLEHFGRHEYLEVLKKWHSKLKSGGVIRISVPDIEKVFMMYNNGVLLSKLMGFLYGGQTYKENYHYIGFDYITLKKVLVEVGFKDIKKWDWRTVEHSNIDDFSQAYIPHMDKENGELMSLNVEAIKI